jgi:IS1 family transposase/transposase-like protein
MQTNEQTTAATICRKCGSAAKRFGHHWNGLRRFRCLACRATFTEGNRTPLRREDYLRQANGLLALQLLLEGASVRSVERLTNLHRDAILALLLIAADKSERLMNRLIVNVPVADVQCDEIWGYVGKKEKNKTPEEADNDFIGDAYCYVSIERNTKLVLNFTLGRRSQRTTDLFIEGLYRATARQRFQLSTDGFRRYIDAIRAIFGHTVDYGMLVKQYGESPEPEKRYSPAKCIGCKREEIMGDPDPDRICTSHIERQNLTLRMQIRRLTRLTNAFSKKWENLRAAYALHFGYYNFCRIHGSLRVTPAMEAGLTDHVWTVGELIS